MKQIFKEVALDGFISLDKIESLANSIFVGGGAHVTEILKSALDSCDINNIDETRFVAQIERILDVASSKGISFDYTTTEALYCIIETQRVAFESTGKYCQAGDAQKLSLKLYDLELSQRQNELKLKHACDLVNITKAHDEQYIAFIKEWDSFEIDFNKRSEKAVASMIDRHKTRMEEYGRKLEIEARGKPRLFSKELKEWRKKQKILAYQENYSEAQKVKRISDAIEKEETSNINAKSDNSASFKSANFRQKQEAELKALAKRIDSQREANKNKRESDCKRLYQRNKNIQAALESKHVTEQQKQSTTIEYVVQTDIANLQRTLKEQLQNLICTSI